MYFLTMASGQSATATETCADWSVAMPFKARRADALGGCADGNLLAVALAEALAAGFTEDFEQKGPIWHCLLERLNQAPVRR